MVASAGMNGCRAQLLSRLLLCTFRRIQSPVQVQQLQSSTVVVIVGKGMMWTQSVSALGRASLKGMGEHASQRALHALGLGGWQLALAVDVLQGPARGVGLPGCGCLRGGQGGPLRAGPVHRGAAPPVLAFPAYAHLSCSACSKWPCWMMSQRLLATSLWRSSELSTRPRLAVLLTSVARAGLP